MTDEALFPDGTVRIAAPIDPELVAFIQARARRLGRPLTEPEFDTAMDEWREASGA